jgi:hypothetical protein
VEQHGWPGARRAGDRRKVELDVHDVEDSAMRAAATARSPVFLFAAAV